MKMSLIAVNYCNLAKKHVFCSDGTVAGMGCKTLARASEVQVQCELAICLAANGSAV